MKKLFLVSILVFISSVGIYSQTPSRNPKPTPHPSTVKLQKTVDSGRDISNRSNNLRLTENFPVKTEKERKIVREKIKPRYRKTTKEERNYLSPSDEDAQKYYSFLKQKDTGLIKLISDKGCASNKNVVNASPQCERLTMPGAGSAYSFRFKDYRILDLSDLNFRKNRFESLGVLNHGFIVYIGDIPLESVTLKTKGVGYLASIKPAKNFNKAAELANKLTKGIKKDGFIYSSIKGVKENSTYVLRSIAYRGESLKTVDGIIYNEMDLDKRKDVIVAFRVVRLNPNEDVTILWKELRSKKAPKLKAK